MSEITGVSDLTEIKKEFVEELIQKIGCFNHIWSNWKPETTWEGEGWERVKVKVYRRTCTECGTGQER